MNANGPFIVIESDRRHYAACANVPEFRFSDHIVHRATRKRARPTQAPAIYGPPIPAGLFPPKHEHHAKRVVDPLEELHIQGKSKFEPKERDWLMPYGTNPGIHAMEFHDRWTEINWIRDTVHEDLPTISEFLHTNGIASASLDAPSPSGGEGLEAVIPDPAFEANHDGLVAGERPKVDPETERDARRYGTPLAIDPIVQRQIEWEKTQPFAHVGCQPNRIFVKQRSDGGRGIDCTDHREKAHLADFVPKMLDLIGDRDLQDILMSQAYVKSVRWLSSEAESAYASRNAAWQEYANPTGEARDELPFHGRLEWRRDPDEYEALILSWAPEDDNDGGPVELTFDGDGGSLVWARGAFGHQRIDEHSASTEPSEYDLWPLSDFEKKYGVPPFELVLARAQQEAYVFV